MKDLLLVQLLIDFVLLLIKNILIIKILFLIKINKNLIVILLNQLVIQHILYG